MAKRRGRHPEKLLTAIAVKRLGPGRHIDGGGLYLAVDPSGARRWILRTVVQGRRRDLGIGSAALVTLSEARERAAEYRKVARDGGDPLQIRRAAEVPTFETAARECFAKRESGWRNAKHAAQWIESLERHAFPVIGRLRVDHIRTAEVLDVLQPLWVDKHETAKRLRQRIGTVLDWAHAKGFRREENPVRSIVRALPTVSKAKGHFAAMPYAELPAFMARLEGLATQSEAKAGLAFLILTAARTGEVRFATWGEFDLERARWTIPAERMKANREHAVPLAPAAVALLRRLQREGDGPSDYVFRNPKGGAFSHIVFQRLMDRLDSPYTVHGFRSSFRDWAGERTDFPREVAERALAHVVKDKAEAAYARTDLFDKRRPLMEAWAAFVLGR